MFTEQNVMAVINVYFERETKIIFTAHCVLRKLKDLHVRNLKVVHSSNFISIFFFFFKLIKPLQYQN